MGTVTIKAKFKETLTGARALRRATRFKRQCRKMPGLKGAHVWKMTVTKRTTSITFKVKAL